MSATATLIEDERELARVAPEWDELAVARERPYCAPAWMLAWWRHVAPSSARLRVVAVRDGEQLIGLAPLAIERARAGVARCRMLAGASAAPIEPLAQPDRVGEVARLVAERLAASRPRIGVVVLEGMPAGSPWPDALARGWPVAGAWRRVDRVVSQPVATLAGDTLEDWMRSRSPRFRQQMRKFRRRLEQGDGSLRPIEDPTEVAWAVEWLERLHTARWRARGGSRAMVDGVPAMVRDAALELVPRERIRLWVAEQDGSPVAVQYVVRAGGCAAAWLQGFDEQHGHARPAQVIVMRAIEDALTRGDTAFEMGPGADELKSRVCDRDEPVADHLLVPRDAGYPVGRLYAASRAGRQAMGERLPPPLKQRARSAAIAVARAARRGP